MIKTVGVIGAGLMGNGIAHVTAACGYNVILTDISMERAVAGLAIIKNNLDRMVKKEKITRDDVTNTLTRITIADNLAILADVDLAIEAATENEELKKKIFTDLCQHLKKEAIILSNTSSISITRLASATDRPGKFMGAHFFNPVPIMQLVELIRGMATNKETNEAVQSFVKSLGKTISCSEDYPGFVVNRILVPMINEAIFALYEGIGTVEDIDLGMELGTNHPMGPLKLADYVGLDTCLSIMQIMQDGLGDSKYRPCPLLIKYVEAGWHGRKSGRGFYDYSGDGDPVPTICKRR